MDKLELAYFGGLFDGEGCIQITHSKPQYGKRTEQHTLICSVKMADEPTVKAFLLFGGRVSFIKLSQKNPHWKDQWLWQISSNQALGFLLIIRNYLRLKMKQADCGIEFQRFRSIAYNNRGVRVSIPRDELEKREWYYNELRRLKDSRFPRRSWHHNDGKDLPEPIKSKKE